MKLIFLGTGSAFTVGDGNYQSNMLLQSPSGRNLLIDCGGDVRLSLYEKGFNFKDIHDVYISHLHADHIGGLEWLAFTSKFILEPSRKPCLHIHQILVDDIWNRSLRGGLNSLKDEKATLSSYFDVKPIADNSFQWEGIDFQLISTVHFESDNELLPTYGLFFKIHNVSIYLTIDTQFTPERLMPYYTKADIIFHDCETSNKKTHCHAPYNQLSSLAPEIKKKMWLYDYNSGALPDAEKDGFKGFIKKGQSFEF